MYARHRVYSKILIFRIVQPLSKRRKQNVRIADKHCTSVLKKTYIAMYIYRFTIVRMDTLHGQNVQANVHVNTDAHWMEVSEKFQSINYKKL